MLRHHRVLLGSIAILLVLAVAGCDKLQEAIEQAANPPVTEPPKSEEAVEADALNGYVACYNHTVSRARESAERYFEYVPREAGPDCDTHKGNLYTLYEDSVEVCAKAVAGAAGGPSYPALEAAVAEFAAANAALVPLVTRVDDYWTQEDFKDDDCAGGKAFHTELVAAFDGFEAAAERFSRELDQVKGEADRRALERVEQRRGRKYEWHVRHLMQVAKVHIKVIPESDVEPIDAAAYGAAFEVLETAHDALATYASANKAELEAIVFMGSGFEDDAKAYYAAAKLVKRAMEAEPRDARELADNVNELVREYNDLIAASNRMTFQYDR